MVPAVGAKIASTSPVLMVRTREYYTGHAVLTIPWYCWQKHLRRSGRQQSAMVVREACPACGDEWFKKNGHMHTGQQNHQCKACGRQCVLHADNRVIGDEQR